MWKCVRSLIVFFLPSYRDGFTLAQKSLQVSSWSFFGSFLASAVSWPERDLNCSAVHSSLYQGQHLGSRFSGELSQRSHNAAGQRGNVLLQLKLWMTALPYVFPDALKTNFTPNRMSKEFIRFVHVSYINTFRNNLRIKIDSKNNLEYFQYCILEFQLLNFHSVPLWEIVEYMMEQCSD